MAKLQYARMDLFETHSKEASDDRSEVESETTAEDSSFDLALKGSAATATYIGSRNSTMTVPKPSPPPGEQLIMFYSGSVSVFDAVSPEKAQAIMMIAAATAVASRASANKTAAVAAASKAPVVVGPAAVATAAPASTAPVLTRTLSFLSSSATIGGAPALTQLAPNSSSSLCKLQAALPIARRHSLQRFLEKRRDRVVSKGPYAAEKPLDSAEVASGGPPQRM